MQRADYSRRLPQHREDDASVPGFGEDFSAAHFRALLIKGSHLTFLRCGRPNGGRYGG